MRRFDVCNGDADGLCAVRQWRLHEPADATLITGLKREIALLERVPRDAADEVLVCDLSLQRNRTALLALLDAGVSVRYFDHHAAGEVPRHVRLDAHIDPASAICTSLLVDRALGGRFQTWALVGAYGDDLAQVADGLAAAAGLDAGRRAELQRLGQAINYNAYGEEAGDVLIAPARLYEILARWPDPVALLAHEPIVDELDGLRRADLSAGLAVAPYFQSERARVVVLPDAPWSRRVCGTLANTLAAARPQQAQAVLWPRRSGELNVSVRAPRAAPGGADRLCAAFGGSGRAAAAGVDALPPRDLDRFVQALSAARWPGPDASGASPC